MWSPALVQWPFEHQRRAQLASAGIPRLLIVAAGTEIPDDIGVDEDWVRMPASEMDVAARLANLEHRFSQSIRLDGRALRRHGVTVTLSETEARVMAILLDQRGRLVPRSDLASAVTTGSASDRQLHDTMHRLRRRLRPLGLDVFAATRRGYALGLRIDDSQ